MARPSVHIPPNIIQATEMTLASENRLIIKAYGFIPATEHFIRDFVRKILSKFNHQELAPAIALVIKELTVNAAKANFKKIFFNEHNIDPLDAESYESGLALFRDSINENMSFEYGRKAKDARLKVHASFDFDVDRLIIEIKNNLGMTQLEERRAREKLKAAMQCEDVAAFMMENVDETEGAGLGLMLSLTALRSSGIDPHLLTVSTNYKDETVARLEIPLNEQYTPARFRWRSPIAS